MSMLLPRVYIETSIPSFYCGSRTDPESVARRNWTQHWWDFKRENYELFTGSAVLEELARWDSPFRSAALSLLKDVPLLPTEPPVAEIVETYIRHSVMPTDPSSDALHLALASYHKCEFLVTWNCKHLANAHKFRHIRRINTLLGLYVPALVTPLELLGQEP
jgi:predicted nucleic acid-binding protein